MPALDVLPYGLGWRLCPTTHVFDALGVALPRGELAARERYHCALEQDRREMERERKGRKGVQESRADELNQLSELVDSCQLARRYYREDVPTACIAVDHLLLEPGEQAVVPVRFDKLPPAEDFLVEPLPEQLCPVAALQGLCAVGADRVSDLRSQ